MRILNTVEHDNCKISIDKLIATILYTTIPLFTIFGFPFVIDYWKSNGGDKGLMMGIAGILIIATVLIIIHPIDIWEDTNNDRGK